MKNVAATPYIYNRRFLAGAILSVLFAALPVQAEVILQYFGTPWMEIARRMPELAEAGYDALWLPPPQKASGKMSVGFDTCDRFDLGDTPRNDLPTKYGTRTDLLHMMNVAHRFGIRVYFDNIMAHAGGFMPSGEPYQLNDIGFVPADFHILRRPDGSYYKVDWPDWNDEWQVLYRNPFSWDIANDPGEWNNCFGVTEGSKTQKWTGVRHPGHPEFYPDLDLPITVSFLANGEKQTKTMYTFANKEPWQDIGYTNSLGTFAADAAGNGRFDWEDRNKNRQHDPGESCEPFEDSGLFPNRPDRKSLAWGAGDRKYNMGDPVPEEINQMLERAVRWLTDQTHADGYRLDAVKHVRAEFFGDNGPDKDSSDYGYCGQIQAQHNLTHGYNDWSNHRDSMFDLSAPRNDAMIYGEHLGAPPPEGPYLDRGMRIANDWFLNSIKFNISNSVENMDQRGFGIFNGNPDHVVHYVMSHDNNYLEQQDRKLAHAALLARESIAIVYTDGYNQSNEKENWFPKPALVPFLGQFDHTWMTDLLDIRRRLGAGRQGSRLSSRDLAAWSRGPAESPGQTDMLFLLARSHAEKDPIYEGEALFPEGAVLCAKTPSGERPVKVLKGKIREMNGSSLRVKAGDYCAISWFAPDLPATYGNPPADNNSPITILQNGTPAPMMRTLRRDGRDGDPAFNRHVLLPRVTSASDLAFIARADGSAENILMKLDGGIDLNAQIWPDMEQNKKLGARDNPPGLAPDPMPGFEQMKFVHRRSADPKSSDDLPSVFPFSQEDITRKRAMETRFEISGFNADTITWFPHNNWGQITTGLPEGFHILRARAFLRRAPEETPVFREFTQTFYLDRNRPSGHILEPSSDGSTVTGTCPFVIRTDMTVTDVWRQIREPGTDHAGPWARVERTPIPRPNTDGSMEQEWRFDYIPAQEGPVEIAVLLREASSSSNPGLDDATGHFTTLTRKLVNGTAK